MKKIETIQRTQTQSLKYKDLNQVDMHLYSIKTRYYLICKNIVSKTRGHFAIAIKNI